MLPVRRRLPEHAVGALNWAGPLVFLACKSGNIGRPNNAAVEDHTGRSDQTTKNRATSERDDPALKMVAGEGVEPPTPGL